jgi:hypothetical protein
MATALIIDELNSKTKQIFSVGYPQSIIVKDILPFRVNFTAIQIQAIGLGNTPGIGLQVIGYSNYIL